MKVKDLPVIHIIIIVTQIAFFKMRSVRPVSLKKDKHVEGREEAQDFGGWTLWEIGLSRIS